MRQLIIAFVLTLTALPCSAQQYPSPTLKNLTVNGTVTLNGPIAGSSGAALVSGPGSSTPGDLALWNNGAGTLLKDLSPSSLPVTPTGGSQETLANLTAPLGLNVVSALTYGVKCNGTADDGPALNTFFAAIGANQVGILPPGVCNFSSVKLAWTPAQGSKLYGAGPYTTTLSYSGSGTTGDLFTIGSLSAPSVDLDIESFRITSQTMMTSGAGFHIEQVGRSFFRDIIADGQDGTGKLYDGYWFDQVDNVFLDGYDAKGQYDGLIVDGGVGAGKMKADLTLVNGKIEGFGHSGVHIAGAFGGFYGISGNVIINNVNFLIDNAVSAEGNREIFTGPTFIIDSATTDGVQIDDTMASSGTLQLGGWIASSGHNGVNDIAWSGNVEINGSHMFNNTQDGIKIGDTSIFTISPSTLISNNGGYGVDATVPTNNIYPGSQPLNNTAGDYSADANVQSYSATEGGTGYVKYPNGAIHEWGTTTVTGAANAFISATVTFPLTFPNHAATFHCQSQGFANGAAQITTQGQLPGLNAAQCYLVSSGTVTNAQTITWDAWGN